MSFIFVNHSPKDPVKLNVPVNKPLNTPNNLNAASANVFNIVRTIFKNENNPLKVDLTFCAASSLNFNFSVNSFNPLVNPANCSEVVGGNISLNASFIGFIIDFKASAIFLID